MMHVVEPITGSISGPAFDEYSLSLMTDDQLAALISFGVPAVLCCVYLMGHKSGARRASRVMRAHAQQERATRIERWTPPPPVPGGEPGTPERLLSDYEDAIYAEARHNAIAQFGDGDERHHASVAAQLHTDVRRLRGRVLADILAIGNGESQDQDDRV